MFLTANAVLERIMAYPEKGAVGKELAKGLLIANLGLEGDFHARGGDRQISLLFAESRETMKEEGLCFLRFRENLSIRGFALPALTPGKRLAAGEALLEITGETKRCHEECVLYEEGKQCGLAGLNLFAKVLKGGVIRTGDKVELA
jgi:MOSC domain-containing protein YiiM